MHWSLHREIDLSKRCFFRPSGIHSTDLLFSPCRAFQAFVNKFNQDYEQKHLAFETQFWGTKMALADREEVKFSAENLSKTKTEM